MFVFKVVVNEQMSVTRRENIKLLFEELDTWFGTKTIGQTPVISLYGSFDSNDSILFPVSLFIIFYLLLHQSIPF